MNHESPASDEFIGNYLPFTDGKDPIRIPPLNCRDGAEILCFRLKAGVEGYYGGKDLFLCPDFIHKHYSSAPNGAIPKPETQSQVSLREISPSIPGDIYVFHEIKDAFLCPKTDCRYWVSGTSVLWDPDKNCLVFPKSP